MESDLIYDVGMNNGDDTAYYLHKGYRVVAIEAHPVQARKAAERFENDVAEGRLTILNIAVSEEEAELPFWVCESVSEWSSFDRKIASRQGAPHRRITVHGKRFSDILKMHGVPYYLKVDIEGSDLLCVRALSAHDLPAISFD